MNNATPPTTPSPDTPHYAATFHDWLIGARTHTWPNAIGPVLVGTAAAIRIMGAHWLQDLIWVRALLAMVVSWALIVGVNFANDYSDGIRGTDDDRVGPQRLTGSGLAKPSHVKAAAFGFFGLAGVAGIALCLISGFWWLILVGICCVLAAWFYTGGKHPYGYRGLGEVMVFIFFGLVAVMGTQLTQLGHISWEGAVAAVAVGAFSCANNLVNNLRDIPSDSASGKITLAVRLGDKRTRILDAFLVFGPFILSCVLALSSVWTLLSLLALPLAWNAYTPVRTGQVGHGLVVSLKQTGKAMLVWSLLLGVGLALGTISLGVAIG